MNSDFLQRIATCIQRDVGNIAVLIFLIAHDKISVFGVSTRTLLPVDRERVCRESVERECVCRHRSSSSVNFGSATGTVKGARCRQLAVCMRFPIGPMHPSTGRQVYW